MSCGGSVTSEVHDKLFISDHQAVVTHFGVQTGSACRVSRTNVYNYKRADFASLRQTLRSVPWTILENMDVDSAVELFYDIVYAAVNEHVPTVELRRKFPPWFSRAVRDLLREKERAHKLKKIRPLRREHQGAREG